MNPSLYDSSGTEIPVLVRRSARAVNMRISIRESMQVTVVLPDGVSESEVQPLIDRHKAWILRTLLKFRRRQSCGTMKFFRHPDRLSIPLANACYPVRYEWRDVSWTGARLDNGFLTVSGRLPDPDAVRSVLREWLIRTARQILGVRLKETADRFGFRYEKMTVRLQEGRWGSCSSRGAVSLNARLLFLPPELADYILIHELCHLKHMNHSRAFWKSVEQFCPDYLIRRERLKKMERSRELPLI